MNGMSVATNLIATGVGGHVPDGLAWVLGP